MDHYPKAFNLMLILSLVILTAISAFLISDILSFGPDAPENELFSAASVAIPKGGMEAISSWKESATKLIAPDKFEGSVNVSHNDTAENLSEAGEAEPLELLDTSVSTKENLDAAEDDNLADLASSSNAPQNTMPVSLKELSSNAAGNSDDRRSGSNQPAQERSSPPKNDGTQLKTFSAPDTDEENSSQTNQTDTQNSSSNENVISTATELESGIANRSSYQLNTETVEISNKNSSIVTTDSRANLSELILLNASEDASKESNSSPPDPIAEAIEAETYPSYSSLPDEPSFSENNSSQPETGIDAMSTDIYPATAEVQTDSISDFSLDLAQTSGAPAPADPEQMDLEGKEAEAPEEMQGIAPVSSDQPGIQESNTDQPKVRTRQVRTFERAVPSSRLHTTRYAESEKTIDDSGSEDVGSQVSSASEKSASGEPQKSSSNAGSGPIHRPKRPERPSRPTNPR